MEEKKLIDFQPEWGKLVLKAQDYESLNSAERVWFNVQNLIQSVDNGGLISYYYNSDGDYLADCMQDLLSIGAPQIVDLLRKINELFPNGKPSRDIEGRNKIISSWEDGKYDGLLEELDTKSYHHEEDLENLLTNHIMRNRLAGED